MSVKDTLKKQKKLRKEQACGGCPRSCDRRESLGAVPLSAAVLAMAEALRRIG